MLQVSGEAHILWGEDDASKDVRVKVLAVLEAKAANPLRMTMRELSPFNPPVSVLTGAVATGQSAAAQQQGQRVVQCTEVVDVAKGVKSFRFQAAESAPGGLPSWTPGQVGTGQHSQCR